MAKPITLKTTYKRLQFILNVLQIFQDHCAEKILEKRRGYPIEEEYYMLHLSIASELSEKISKRTNVRIPPVKSSLQLEYHQANTILKGMQSYMGRMLGNDLQHSTADTLKNQIDQLMKSTNTLITA